MAFQSNLLSHSYNHHHKAGHSQQHCSIPFGSTTDLGCSFTDAPKRTTGCFDPPSPPAILTPTHTPSPSRGIFAFFRSSLYPDFFSSTHILPPPTRVICRPLRRIVYSGCSC
ncbi:hypothetical protein AVEN_275032-1 [Araneus ventricosus]|uniref:Uncharacterized protein n=1 Tax=Araneus ventricosus TaxID=182803 RepID=A0A4Y2EWK1_ARAVE|nr:hypothetical protein AVEN_275032-1 [Araneus ventricosus]